MSEVAPVAEQRRIQSLDVVRGLALLGILAVNAAYFAAPLQAAQNPLLPPIAIDDSSYWAWFVMHVFFEMKMITLFSMLFGASIYMVGGERSDLERGAVLRRRLAWLMLIGMLHGALIWYGDILFNYALTGLLVLFARSWKPRMLMIVGIALFALSLLIMMSFGSILSEATPARVEEWSVDMWSPPAAEITRIIEAYQAGLVSATAENFRLWQEFLAYLWIFVIRTAGVMMIGLALFKWGFFSGAWRVRHYGAVAAVGAVALAWVAWQAQVNAEREFEFLYMMTRGQLANMALSPFISLLYASVLIAMVRVNIVQRVTDALAAVGRMAFTNYLTQSLIMTTIFYGGRGLGLYGELNREQLWALVLGIWVLQLIWSPLWLARYQMGPFEWVWRRLSYAKPLNISKPASTVGGQA